jgi:NAD(P)H-flavin reductase
MNQYVNPIQSVSCQLIVNNYINIEISRLDFIWQSPDQTELTAPKAGQFFMIKPKRSAVFLGRPISVARWEPALKDRDLISKQVRGKKKPYKKFWQEK